MPMQPRPRAETAGPSGPRVRVGMLMPRRYELGRAGTREGRAGFPGAGMPSATARRSRRAASSAHERRHASTSGRSGARDVAEEVARDDQALDLARALVDLGDLRVAVVALGGEVLRVPVAAEDLDRLARDPARDAGGEQ